MTKYITEILEEINNDISRLKSYKDNYAIRTILEYAFDPDKKFDLPEGPPPYRVAPEPLGMTPSNFYSQVKKLYIFTRKDLKPMRKEMLFIQLCESIHQTEAAVCVAIKDQKLTEMYNNITLEAVQEAGIVKQFRVATDAAEQSPAGKNLVLNLEDTANITDKIGGKNEGIPEEPVKKKRGRPRKVVEESAKVEEPVKKKRGRPRKIAA